MLVTFNIGNANKLINLELENQSNHGDVRSFYRQQDQKADNWQEVLYDPANNVNKRSWQQTIRPLPQKQVGKGLETKLIGSDAIDNFLVNYLPAGVTTKNIGQSFDIENKMINIPTDVDTDDFTIVVGRENLIRLQDVLYIHGTENISCIHTNEASYRIGMGLIDLTATISHPYFVRVKPGCTINASHLFAFNDLELYLKSKGKIIKIRYNEYPKENELKLCEFTDFECVMPELLERVSPDLHHWFMQVELIIIKQLKNRMFSISNVANEMGVCARQFQRIFIQNSGLMPKTFAREFCLLYARKRLLESPDRKIESIALNSGFKDVQYFKKIFRDRFGYDPCTLN